ncbi:hypothetical protein [Halorhabdus amylolytica]|uniref:hypothetical protein n=1 Tax=Halorhabdus amylolytica TaxID=2559573 RepID=UPI0010AA8E9D|nr:hypothetical protein [Halorhabdus amylolytica]
MVEDNGTSGVDGRSDDGGPGSESGPGHGADRLADENDPSGGGQPFQTAGNAEPSPRGNDGGGSWLPGGARWTPLTILAVLVLVGGVAAAGAFIATGGDVPMLGASGGSASLDAVPEDVDIVMYADGGIVDDDTTKTMVNGVLEMSSQDPSYSGPSNYDELLSEANSETALDVDAFDSATMFATYPEGSAATAEYAGAVIESDWTEDDLVNSIEETGGSVQEQTYAGTTVYVQTSEFGTDTWLAPLGDGTFVVGTEVAVTDAIDVENGDANALSGDLRSSFTDLRDGYVKFAATLPEDASGQAGSIPQGGRLAQNVRAASGVYYTSGEDVGMEVHLTGTDQSSAESVKESIDGLLSFAAVGAQDSPTADLIDAMEVSQDGQQVTITFEYPAQKLVTVMEQLSGVEPTA